MGGKNSVPTAKKSDAASVVKVGTIVTENNDRNAPRSLLAGGGPRPGNVGVVGRGNGTLSPQGEREDNSTRPRPALEETPSGSCRAEGEAVAAGDDDRQGAGWGQWRVLEDVAGQETRGHVSSSEVYAKESQPDTKTPENHTPGGESIGDGNAGNVERERITGHQETVLENEELATKTREEGATGKQESVCKNLPPTGILEQTEGREERLPKNQKWLVDYLHIIPEPPVSYDEGKTSEANATVAVVTSTEDEQVGRDSTTDCHPAAAAGLRTTLDSDAGQTAPEESLDCLEGALMDPATARPANPGDGGAVTPVGSTKLMIFGKSVTVLEVAGNGSSSDNSTKTPGHKKRKRRRRSGSRRRPDRCKEAAAGRENTNPGSWPEESMYHLGCKPRQMYIELPSPLEKNASVFGYVPDFFPAETVLGMTEEEKVTTVTRSESLQQSRRATLHRKSEPQTDDTQSKMKLWCFNTEEAVGRRAAVQDSFKEPFKEEEFFTQSSMIAIGGRLQEVLEDHFNKITEVQSRLEQIREEGQSQEEVELLEVDLLKACLLEMDASEVLTHEERALQDKEKELNQHTLEFLLYLKRNYDNLHKVWGGATDCGWKMKAAIFRECRRLSNALPIYARRSDVINTIKANQVTVLVGETGCGKSTQIPQYLFEAGFADRGMIVCTQPRKVAAVSLAYHVAGEVDGRVGGTVGYKVGRNSRMTDMTDVVYVTDQILLNECLRDGKLSSFSCVIVDEAHERSIFSDLLIGMVKKCIQSRPDLRVVITSATIDPEVFIKYFRGCPVLHVTGRQFPVEVKWRREKDGREPFSNYENEAVQKAIKVYRTTDQGDILVFLTNPIEAERCCSKFEMLVEEKPKKYMTIPLHGKLGKEQQEKVFAPSPDGERKVIFATNSGETSVTIPTVKFVIDTGLAREMIFDDKCKMNVLCLCVISQSRATQRLGRAGRLCPGRCYRLYTKEDYRDMDSTSAPEIQSSNIGLALLKLMSLNIDPLEFDYITPPSKESLEEATASLVSIGAIRGRKLTELGRCISQLPLEPKYGALVYEGKRAGILLDTVVIAAANPWSTVFQRAKNHAVRKQIASLCHPGGDQLTVLNVFKEWFKVRGRPWRSSWCTQHFVCEKIIIMINEAVKDILYVLNNSWNLNVAFVFRESKTQDALLTSLLFKVFNRNLSYMIGHPEATYCIASKEQTYEVNLSSITRFFDTMPEWIVFDMITVGSKGDLAKNITPVPERILLKGIREGWLSLPIEQIKRTRRTVVCEEFVGDQLVKEFFNPKLDHLKKIMSVLMNKSPDSEADVVGTKRKGLVKVVAVESSRPDLSGCLAKALSPLRTKLQVEKRLQRVGSRSEGVRAVIGAGGAITSILMPEECKVVTIHGPQDSVQVMSEEDVIKIFEQFGEIEDCRRFIQTQKSTLWGYVVYRKIQSAIEAIRKTKDRSEGVAHPNGGSCFTKKVQWSSVGVVENGYVTFSHKKYVDKAKMCDLRLCSSFGGAQFAQHEQDNTLRILSVGKVVPEETFRHDLARVLNINPVRDILEVKMPRENKSDSENMRRSLLTQLVDQMGHLAEPDLFHLYFRPPHEEDSSLTAFCIHRSPGDASAAWKGFSRHLLLKEEVRDEAFYYSSIYILKQIFGAHEKQLVEEVEELEDEGVVVAIRYCRNKDVMLYLGTEDPHVLAEANEAIGNIITGEVVSCEGDPRGKLLFSPKSCSMFVSVMMETDTVIVTDDRAMTMSIHGSEESRERARAMIGREIPLLSQEKHEEIRLIGVGKPRGLMGFLTNQFGSDLVGLEIEADLDSVKLDYRNHRLWVSGPASSIKAAADLVKTFERRFTQGEIEDDTEPLDPECVVCLYPAQAEDMYRLDCGHGYCKTCLKLHFDFAIVNKVFPVVCIDKKCKTMFLWRDIAWLADEGLFDLSKLVTASVRCFVSQHREELRYCLTALCPSVYRVTEIGTPFTCPECRTTICTTCHTFYHSGLSCSEYNSIMEET